MTSLAWILIFYTLGKRFRKGSYFLVVMLSFSSVPLSFSFPLFFLPLFLEPHNLFWTLFALSLIGWQYIGTTFDTLTCVKKQTLVCRVTIPPSPEPRHRRSTKLFKRNLSIYPFFVVVVVMRPSFFDVGKNVVAIVSSIRPWQIRRL